MQKILEECVAAQLQATVSVCSERDELRRQLAESHSQLADMADKLRQMGAKYTAVAGVIGECSSNLKRGIIF